ncbi:MAG: flagellar motor switch protein FliM [Bryobacterales bacterium]|nr:flagellar motor switch protein FliM [Bryobacterales bacterium]
MGTNRVLSQEEIDNVFKKMSGKSASSKAMVQAMPYDFRRPDRIPKDQLREIHLLHENFCRNLAGSLSAYLRASVTVNLISVLQLSYSEFLQCFPSPTSISILSLRPYEGKGVLELNPSLVFPIIEILMGGQGKPSSTPKREITEIERSILESAQRLILRDLREAWTSVANFDLALEKTETEPQLVQTLSPNEAVVAVGVEVRVGECMGMLNFGVPAIIIKMLRQRFDQRWNQRRSAPTQEERERILSLIQPARLEIEAVLDGATIALQSLIRMQVGDIIALDYPVERPVQVTIGGKQKHMARIAMRGGKKVVQVEASAEQTRLPVLPDVPV